MTEGEKRCGLGSFLPMSCRGRAEAFARRLHNRLRTLGSQDDVDDPHTSESWLANNEISNNTIVTNCQPRHSGTESDLLMDLGIFDSPGSPVELNEITKFITNPKDDLHHLNLDECGCLTTNHQIVKRNSLDSDSSEYFDPEIQDPKATNGVELNEPSDEVFDEPETILVKEEVESEWTLCFDPNNVINSNNNVYNAIDLESLKSCIEPDDLYSSRLEILQDLTIECPELQVSTLEIPECIKVETLEIPECLKVETLEIPEFCNDDETDKNHLKVETSPDDLELEDRSPRVRRCSSLKTGKTPPGTPGRKKIVRFADVLGLDLADVRTFLDEIPKVPISAYDDLSVTDLTSTCPNPIASGKMLVSCFQQPGGETDFMDKIRNNQVCLENAVVKDSIALCVCGTVRVRNLDFNKSVHIRYSLDQWKSFSDLQATYVDNSCDGFSDKFSFTLYVHTLTVGQRLEFAVRYQCKGCQYWDNNAGVNYCFQCMPPSTTSSSSYTTVTAPDDATWAGAAFY